MKKRLLYLVLCVFAVMTANAQVNSVAIVGTAVGGWPGQPGNPGPIDVHQLTKVDADNWKITGLTIAAGPCKLRANNAWGGAGFEWAGAFPTATGTSSGDITVPTASVYTVELNATTGVYLFTAEAALPVVNIVGPGGVGSVAMTATSPTTFKLDGATLAAGTYQFQIDGVLSGDVTFPMGFAAAGTANIPVTAGTYTTITIDLNDGSYNFVAAPLYATITMTGSAVVGVGWGNDTAVFGHTTVDDYFLHDVALLATDGCKFRKDMAYATTWGNNTPTGFPAAVSNGQNIIPNVAGNYDAKLNIVTGAYSFAFPLISITGEAATGWGNDTDLATTDGENYTLSGITLTNALPGQGIKFRRDHDYTTTWGDVTFPNGVSTGNNIPCTAGTYNVTFTRSTGTYNFTNALAVTKFDANTVSVYPNPTTNSWNFRAANTVIKSIQIFDINGKSVKTVSAKDSAATVDASGLSKGVYFAKVSSDTATETLKLIKN